MTVYLLYTVNYRPAYSFSHPYIPLLPPHTVNFLVSPPAATAFPSTLILSLHKGFLHFRYRNVNPYPQVLSVFTYIMSNVNPYPKQSGAFFKKSKKKKKEKKTHPNVKIMITDVQRVNRCTEFTIFYL